MEPPSLLLLQDATDEQFDAFTANLLRRLDPDDAIGRILAELLILAAGRLRRAARFEPAEDLPGLDWCRYHSLAERNARAALKDFSRHLQSLDEPARPASSKTSKGKTKVKVTGADSESGSEPEAEPNPEPLPESTPEEIAEASSNWRSHIALVRSVSEEWPILLRLRLEVEDVAAWLLDGKSEQEMMRWYPGLTPADIAACRSCDAAGLCGPFDPADGPYPPGLPVLDDLPDDSSS